MATQGLQVLPGCCLHMIFLKAYLANEWRKCSTWLWTGSSTGLFLNITNSYVLSWYWISTVRIFTRWSGGALASQFKFSDVVNVPNCNPNWLVANLQYTVEVYLLPCSTFGVTPSSPFKSMCEQSHGLLTKRIRSSVPRISSFLKNAICIWLGIRNGAVHVSRVNWTLDYRQRIEV